MLQVFSKLNPVVSRPIVYIWRRKKTKPADLCMEPYWLNGELNVECKRKFPIRNNHFEEMI